MTLTVFLGKPVVEILATRLSYTLRETSCELHTTRYYGLAIKSVSLSWPIVASLCDVNDADYDYLCLREGERGVGSFLEHALPTIHFGE
jgi:hypothetical protein